MRHYRDHLRHRISAASRLQFEVVPGADLRAGVRIGPAGLVAHSLCGMFGVALGALGMLGTLTRASTIDALGPISDNTGGVAELAQLDEWVSHRYFLVISLSSS